MPWISTFHRWNYYKRTNKTWPFPSLLFWICHRTARSVRCVYWKEKEKTPTTSRFNRAGRISAQIMCHSKHDAIRFFSSHLINVKHKENNFSWILFKNPFFSLSTVCYSRRQRCLMPTTNRCWKNFRTRL